MICIHVHSSRVPLSKLVISITCHLQKAVERTSTRASHPIKLSLSKLPRRQIPGRKHDVNACTPLSRKQVHIRVREFELKRVGGKSARGWRSRTDGGASVCVRARCLRGQRERPREKVASRDTGVGEGGLASVRGGGGGRYCYLRFIVITDGGSSR